VIKFVNKEDSEDEEPTTNKKLTKLEKLKQKIENIK
jgi:hypothetical protein